MVPRLRLATCTAPRLPRGKITVRRLPARKAAAPPPPNPLPPGGRPPDPARDSRQAQPHGSQVAGALPFQPPHMPEQLGRDVALPVPPPQALPVAPQLPPPGDSPPPAAASAHAQPKPAPACLAGPWNQRMAAQLDEELQARIHLLKTAWNIPLEPWSPSWPAKDLEAMTTLLAVSRTEWESNGWTVQPFEWEYKHLQATAQPAKSTRAHPSHKKVSRLFGKRACRQGGLEALPVLPADEPARDSALTGVWSPVQPSHKPPIDPRTGPKVSSSTPATLLPVPDFAIGLVTQPFNPAGFLHVGRTQDGEEAEAASPTGSWSSDQPKSRKPKQNVSQAQHRPKRPQVLLPPEEGTWCWFDGRGVQCGEVSMTKIREMLEANVIAPFSSIYRKEDGLWLPARCEPWDEDALVWSGSPTIGEAEVESWFEGVAAAAENRGTCAVRGLLDNAALNIKGAAWESCHLVGNSPTASANDAERWFEEYSEAAPGEDVRSSADTMRQSPGMRHLVGPPPPPQFCAMLRAEIHKKIVYGGAGKLMVIHLLQNLADEWERPNRRARPRECTDAAAHTAKEAEDSSIPKNTPFPKQGSTAAKSESSVATVPKRKRLLEDAGHEPSATERKELSAMNFFSMSPQRAAEKERRRKRRTPTPPHAPPMKHVERNSDRVAKEGKTARQAVQTALELLLQYDENHLEGCFSRPVVETFPNVEEAYLRKISKPIALSDMMEKLHRQEYSWQDLEKDMRLMMRNCESFNAGEKKYLWFARKMSKKFAMLSATYGPAGENNPVQ
uniref:Bromo domain-containing protein n=1 Tax=Tetraselmis sp. GSL018 TaxID=582737 RepID=A0A061QSU1_9CHLO